MAHPNEDLIRKGYAAFAAGDLDTLRQLFAPDIVWHNPGRNPLSGTEHGIDAVFQSLGRLAELTGGTFRVGEIHDVLANDEHAVALLRTYAERGGKALESNDVHVFNMSNGRVTEFWSVSGDQYSADELLNS
jgi:ketosteroid isomerase-like protein